MPAPRRTSLRRLFTTILVGAVGWIATSGFGVAADTKTATIYVVRHAEKVLNPQIPALQGVIDKDWQIPLTAPGMARSLELSKVLRTAKLSGVYSTKYVRAWQTAHPTATAAGLKVQPYDQLTPQLLARWKSIPADKDENNTLIVGHSGTVEKIVKALSGVTVPPVGHNEYNNLFVITIRGAKQTVEHRTYGALSSSGTMTFVGKDGKPYKPADVSAIARVGKFLVVGSDEETSVDVLSKTGGSYRVIHTVPLTGGDSEIDIEGIAAVGNRVYVAGSHSWRRKSIQRKKDLKKKRSQLEKRFFDESPQRQSDRDKVFRFDLNLATGELVADSMKPTDIRGVLEKDAVLDDFTLPRGDNKTAIASKENGVDIEGLAVDGEYLCFGFRSPVLRFNFVGVLRVKFDAQFKNPKDVQMRFLQLDGRGIRDIVKVQTGFLLIAGPPGDGDRSYRLYHWDGKDVFPGTMHLANKNINPKTLGKVVLLGTLPTPRGAKAEGLVVLKDANSQFYEFLILYDGPAGGRPTKFRARKPRTLQAG